MARIGSLYYVADQESRYTIQVFDREAGFVGSIGRRGEGPQEFAQIMDLDVDSAENLWALDSRNGRVSVMRVSGSQPEFLETFRLPAGVQIRSRNSMTLIPDGRALVNSQAYVNGEVVTPTVLINRNGIDWSVSEDSLNAPGNTSSRRVYALDGQGGYWTAANTGSYRLELRRLSDGGLVRSFEPRRPWHDEHRENVRLPARPGDPPDPDGGPPGRVQQAARIQDIHYRDGQLWVIGWFDDMSHGRLDVFNATDGSLLFAQEMAPSVFFGFDDDGFLMEYEGGDKPPRLVFWRMTLNL